MAVVMQGCFCVEILARKAEVVLYCGIGFDFSFAEGRVVRRSDDLAVSGNQFLGRPHYAAAVGVAARNASFPELYYGCHPELISLLARHFFTIKPLIKITSKNNSLHNRIIINR